jgi:hypothetical protein
LSALAASLVVVAAVNAQGPPPFEPPVQVKVVEFRPLTTQVNEQPQSHTTVDQSAKQDGAAPPLPAGLGPVTDPDENAGACAPPARHQCWSEVWGYAGLDLFPAGNRMAPNGVLFRPLGALDFEFNLGLLPAKELYLFADNRFWAQKAGADVTNPSQGSWDFSKREFDLSLGIAWTYYNALELRASTYAFSNLNRGESLISPHGFKDGTLLENRYYLGNADIYDVGRLSFLSVGYYPSKTMVTGDGVEFKPGLFARAYLTYDLPVCHAYLYFDGTFTAERVVKCRLLEMDAGLAARPFERFGSLEFRLGYDVIGDVQADTARGLFYLGVRVVY